MLVYLPISPPVATTGSVIAMELLHTCASVTMGNKISINEHCIKNAGLNKTLSILIE
jgi:hypothetical protein